MSFALDEKRMKWSTCGFLDFVSIDVLAKSILSKNDGNRKLYAYRAQVSTSALEKSH